METRLLGWQWSPRLGPLWLDLWGVPGFCRGPEAAFRQLKPDGEQNLPFHSGRRERPRESADGASRPSFR